MSPHPAIRFVRQPGAGTVQFRFSSRRKVKENRRRVGNEPCSARWCGKGKLGWNTSPVQGEAITVRPFGGKGRSPCLSNNYKPTRGARHLSKGFERRTALRAVARAFFSPRTQRRIKGPRTAGQRCPRAVPFAARCRRSRSVPRHRTCRRFAVPVHREWRLRAPR